MWPLKLCRSIVVIAGIVLLRFPPIPRIWALSVVAVNAIAIVFANTVFGQIALMTVGVGIVVMAFLHARLGFVRLLGIGHILWIPMLPWLAFELPSLDPDTWLYRWLLCLLAINSVCLVVDAIDVARYLAGERSPHYAWGRDSTASP